MTAATLTRRQRRQLRRLTHADEATIEADRRFFARRPDRSYRIRRMSRAEIAQAELTSGRSLHPLAAGSAPFAVVKQIAPGVRLRIFVPGPSDEDGSNASDELGAFLWDRYVEANPDVGRREDAFREALFAPGGPLHGEGGR